MARMLLIILLCVGGVIGLAVASTFFDALGADSPLAVVMAGGAAMVFIAFVVHKISDARRIRRARVAASRLAAQVMDRLAAETVRSENQNVRPFLEYVDTALTSGEIDLDELRSLQRALSAGEFAKLKVGETVITDVDGHLQASWQLHRVVFDGEDLLEVIERTLAPFDDAAVVAAIEVLADARRGAIGRLLHAWRQQFRVRVALYKWAAWLGLPFMLLVGVDRGWAWGGGLLCAFVVALFIHSPLKSRLETCVFILLFGFIGFCLIYYGVTGKEYYEDQDSSGMSLETTIE